MTVLRHPNNNGVTLSQWRKTAAGGETSLSGTDDFSAGLSYTVGAEQVFVNGVLIERGVDYTASTGTTVTGLTALVAGDIVTVSSPSSFQVANAIPKNTITAKGDLIVATGASTPANLAVGADGSTLVADSSTSTGLRYQGTPYSGKNILINGAFDIWQRGTSFAATPANFAYLADRWFWIGATCSIAQETTIVPTGFQYSMKATATGTTQPVFGQTVETKNCYQLAGKTVTLSAWMATSTAANVTLRIDYSTAVDNPSSGTWTTITSTAGSNDVSSTATMTRKSLSFAIPANALSLRILFLTAANITSGTTFTLTGCQLEDAAGVSAFTRNAPTLQGELTACQRYYWRNTPAVAYGIHANLTYNNSTTTEVGLIKLPVVMRTTPSSVDYANLRIQQPGVGSLGTISAVGLASESNANNVLLQTTITGSTFVATNPYQLLNDNNTAGYLGFSAEL